MASRIGGEWMYDSYIESLEMLKTEIEGNQKESALLSVDMLKSQIEILKRRNARYEKLVDELRMQNGGECEP